MKKIISLSLIISLFFSLNALSQNVKNRKLDAFNKLYVSGDFDIYVVQGPKESVQIKARGISPDDVITNVEDHVLKIRPRGGAFADYTVNITLTVRTLLEIDCNNSAKVKVKDKVKADGMRFKATTGGIIKLSGEIETLNVEAFQGGNITITGKNKILKANIKSGGVLSATHLESEEVNIKLNTGAKAEVNVSKKITARVNTKSSLSYFGKPESKDLKTTLGSVISAWDE